MPPPRYDAVDYGGAGFDLKTNYNRFDLKGCADDKTLGTRRTGPGGAQAHLQRGDVVRHACGRPKARRGKTHARR